jgi:hypothetical protein
MEMHIYLLQSEKGKPTISCKVTSEEKAKKHKKKKDREGGDKDREHKKHKHRHHKDKEKEKKKHANGHYVVDPSKRQHDKVFISFCSVLCP